MANTEAARTFGYLVDDLVGEQIEMLLPDGQAAVDAEARHDPREAVSAATRLAGHRRDGSMFPAEILLSSLLTEDGLLIAITVHDITARLEGEAERAREGHDPRGRRQAHGHSSILMTLGNRGSSAL